LTHPPPKEDHKVMHVVLIVTALLAGVELGPAHLFFGCRNRKHDYIYEAELADLKAQGGYTHLHTAFSREGDKKVYVQHHLEQHRCIRSTAVTVPFPFVHPIEWREKVVNWGTS